MPPSTLTSYHEEPERFGGLRAQLRPRGSEVFPQEHERSALCLQEGLTQKTKLKPKRRYLMHFVPPLTGIVTAGERERVDGQQWKEGALLLPCSDRTTSRTNSLFNSPQCSALIRVSSLRASRALLCPALFCAYFLPILPSNPTPTYWLFPSARPEPQPALPTPSLRQELRTFSSSFFFFWQLGVVWAY